MGRSPSHTSSQYPPIGAPYVLSILKSASGVLLKLATQDHDAVGGLVYISELLNIKIRKIITQSAESGLDYNVRDLKFAIMFFIQYEPSSVGFW
jgi:hypothetical protein